jgi:uncharacterized membrane protein YeaQ/YmgE (transglycosylase-associated protein family)
MRVARGGLLAITSAALAVSAHALADGGLPDAATTVLLTVLIGWTATALAGKTRGPLPTVAVLGAGQLVMHVVLSTLAIHPESHATNAEAMNGVAMTATHAGATVVTALLVTRAESMLQAVVQAMRLLLPPIRCAAPVLDTVVKPTVPSPEIGRLVPESFRRAHGRRGPPSYS